MAHGRVCTLESHGVVAPFSVPLIVTAMDRTLFRDDPADLRTAWQETQLQKQEVKSRVLYSGYFAVITCPPKEHSSKEKSSGKEQASSNSPPSQSPPSNGKAEGGCSASSGAGGQDPDDNDPKKKLPAWFYEEVESDEIDEEKICNICRGNPATHTAAECCGRKICASCIKALPRDSCALCGKTRNPVYRCLICQDVEKINLEDMHAHMQGHVRKDCGGRVLIFRPAQDEPPQPVFGTISAIIGFINNMLYVSCPFPGCHFMGSVTDFQSHVQDAHESQNCPIEGCEAVVNFQHTLAHLPSFVFSFEHCIFDGTYHALLEQIETQARWLYCQVCFPTHNVLGASTSVYNFLCGAGIRISSAQACYDHCMNAHVSLQCSRCPEQFNCLEFVDAHTHANSHPLYLPVGEEESATMAGLICPYCEKAVFRDENDLVKHMESCYEPGGDL